MSSESSSSVIVMISIIVGAVGAMYLIVRLLIGAGNIHPMICWKISPLYDPGQCLVEKAKFDNPG
ncbi:MAG: hypothetical protein ACAH83_11685 [Alphaproteobacteria bacterium]